MLSVAVWLFAATAQVCSGQLPSPAEAAHFDAILVSGSHYSVYEDYDWIKQLLQALPQYVATGVRIYGCCFGSQVRACIASSRLECAYLCC